MPKRYPHIRSTVLTSEKNRHGGVCVGKMRHWQSKKYEQPPPHKILKVLSLLMAGYLSF